MENIKIQRVINPSQDLLNLTTKWMYEWWGVEENNKYDDVYSYMKNSFNKERLPQTFIMYLDDKIIGMYQITYRDLFVRPNIYPWIANLYVDKDYRKKGYGKILISSIKDQVKKCTPFNELFLYTTYNNLYEKHGWECIEEIDGKNKLYRLKIED